MHISDLMTAAPATPPMFNVLSEGDEHGHAILDPVRLLPGSETR